MHAVAERERKRENLEFHVFSFEIEGVAWRVEGGETTGRIVISLERVPGERNTDSACVSVCGGLRRLLGLV